VSPIHLATGSGYFGDQPLGGHFNWFADGTRENFDIEIYPYSSICYKPDHCVLGVTEQARFLVRMGNQRGTRSKQTVFSNIHSVEKRIADQGF
jgi:hypothetical protein